jgi:short subunit dehydrogenase-like uncharacterized protein
MNDTPNWMIYGATGYTGQLIARHAVARGQRPVLAGRNSQLLAALAHELGCALQVFALDDPRELVSQVGGLSVVLNCAGPFAQTARPMMDACLKSRVDYLDITGEIGVIEDAAQRNEQALRAGVTLMPAVGFDVVPTDCLAAQLAERLPGARNLQLAFAFGGSMSRGTAKTALESLPEGGRVRIAGRIERVPAAWKSMQVPFRDGPKLAMTIPWGDVASAYYTTGIPNIEVYMAAPRVQVLLIRRLRRLFKLFKWPPLAKFARRQIDRQAPGPDAASRERERSSLWGRVVSADGDSVSATLETLSGYHLTMLTAVEAVARVRAGAPKGFMTPARALGSKFILEFPKTDLRWEDEAAAVSEEA